MKKIMITLLAFAITPFLGLILDIYHNIGKDNVISIAIMYYAMFFVYFYAAQGITEMQIEKIGSKPLSKADKIMYLYLPIILSVSFGALISCVYSYVTEKIFDNYLNYLVIMIVPALVGTIKTVSKYNRIYKSNQA